MGERLGAQATPTGHRNGINPEDGEGEKRRRQHQISNQGFRTALHSSWLVQFGLWLIAPMIISERGHGLHHPCPIESGVLAFLQEYQVPGLI
jgi:hypothetical protein